MELQQRCSNLEREVHLIKEQLHLRDARPQPAAGGIAPNGLGMHSEGADTPLGVWRSRWGELAVRQPHLPCSEVSSAAGYHLALWFSLPACSQGIGQEPLLPAL